MQFDGKGKYQIEARTNSGEVFGKYECYVSNGLCQIEGNKNLSGVFVLHENVELTYEEVEELNGEPFIYIDNEKWHPISQINHEKIIYSRLSQEQYGTD